MQITSLNNSRPLIAVLNQQHVVVASGGSWHYDDATGWNVWDTVIYQDPTFGPNETGAASWMDGITSMVIGASATSESENYLDQYGAGVAVRGSTYAVPPKQPAARRGSLSEEKPAAGAASLDSQSRRCSKEVRRSYSRLAGILGTRVVALI
jgi:hypothetical protein